jgi:hypothetical protein
VAVARDLGLQAFRITVPWEPGQTSPAPATAADLDHAVAATFGLRLVLAVYGRGVDAPRTDAARSAYCSYVVELLRRYPTIGDIVIWNEPNLTRFWRPQFDARGRSAAPAAYAALLGRCWDTLHAFRPTVNVIAASSPRGNDNPKAVSNISHSPMSWYRELGRAYRASKRSAPLFDTVGHNAYQNGAAEPPWKRHPQTTSIGVGDYDKLLGVLRQAFSGTRQPLPGEGTVRIWYMELGFQSVVDPAKRAFYRGRENVAGTLPATAGAGGVSQASQLAAAIRLAYCQPAVGGIFNFELVDEPDLAGWQSGVLWADGTPKPAYAAVKKAIADAGAGAVDCHPFG